MIEKYLKKLLVARDEVFAEGFGMFKAEHEAAKVTEEGTLVPPRRLLSFDAEAEGDSAELLAAVSAGEGISEEEAREALRKLAEDCAENFAQSRRFQLEGIGFLEKTGSGVRFLPAAADEADFSPAEYGLPAIDLAKPAPKIIAAPAGEAEIPIAKAAPTADSDRPAEKQTSKTVNKKVKVEDKNKNSELVLMLVGVVAVFILAFAAYLLFNNEAMNGFKAFFRPETEVKIDESTPLPSDSTSTDSSMNAQENFANEEFSTETGTETVASETPAEEKSSEQPTSGDKTGSSSSSGNMSSSDNSGGISGNFYIIAGSYSNKNIAQKMLTEVQGKGIAARLIYSPKQNMHRLALGEFSDLASADARKNELSSQFESLWVLKY